MPLPLLGIGRLLLGRRREESPPISRRRATPAPDRTSPPITTRRNTSPRTSSDRRQRARTRRKTRAAAAAERRKEREQRNKQAGAAAAIQRKNKDTNPRPKRNEDSPTVVQTGGHDALRRPGESLEDYYNRQADSRPSAGSHYYRSLAKNEERKRLQSERAAAARAGLQADIEAERAIWILTLNAAKRGYASLRAFRHQFRSECNNLFYEGDEPVFYDAYGDLVIYTNILQIESLGLYNAIVPRPDLRAYTSAQAVVNASNAYIASTGGLYTSAFSSSLAGRWHAYIRVAPSLYYNVRQYNLQELEEFGYAAFLTYWEVWFRTIIVGAQKRIGQLSARRRKA